MSDQFVIPINGRWGVKAAGAKKFTKIFDTQEEAREYAKQIAVDQQAEVIIDNKSARFRQKNSYGNDPYPPEG